jgi:hypothetical protein
VNGKKYYVSRSVAVFHPPKTRLRKIFSSWHCAPQVQRRTHAQPSLLRFNIAVTAVMDLNEAGGALSFPKIICGCIGDTS